MEAGAVPPVSIATVLDQVIRPEDFLELLAAEYAILEERFVTYGFAVIRRAWLDRAARLGEEITARTTRAETRGVFEDVDDSGALILRTAQGRHAVSAADVYF